MRLSVIIPALNEAPGIAATLRPLQPLRSRDGEVIVVDGGSGDGTCAQAAPLADVVTCSAPGRARQMNAGAKLARGRVLLFLHADTRADAAAVDAVPDALARSGHRWGRFDVTIDGASPLLPVVARLMNLRSRWTGIATGDQGIFADRALFEEVEGFPEQPLMEDIEFSRRAKRAAGAPLCVARRIVTSGRRWDRDGPWRTVAAMWRLRFDYWRGVDAQRLACRYAPPAPLPKRR